MDTKYSWGPKLNFFSFFKNLKQGLTMLAEWSGTHRDHQSLSAFVSVSQGLELKTCTIKPGTLLYLCLVV